MKPLPPTSFPAPAAGGFDTGPASPGRIALILDAPPGTTLAWWLDPVRAILFIVLPIFCFAAYLNQFNFWQYDASGDFVTAQTFMLALFSAAMLLLGIAIGRLAVREQAMVAIIDPRRCTRVLMAFGIISILAYILLLGTLFYRIDLVLELLRGNPSASTELRAALGRIPGVTSLVQFGVVYLTLLSALVTMAGYRMPPIIRQMSVLILVLTVLRVIMNSERLAFLEAMAAIFVTPVAYRWRPSPLRTSAPFLGVVAVFAAFAAGEYFRSWQYYRAFYNSYLEFVTQRFAGYFSTSINNGAGAYLFYGSRNPTPEITVGWVSKFPGLQRFFATDEFSMLNRYLEKYATLEFNNPGGLYAAFLDYPFMVATLFMIVVGMVIGAAHRSFVNRGLMGLMLYPLVFLGVTDLIRILYIPETRTLPIFLGTAIAFYAVRPLQMPRAVLVAQAGPLLSRQG